MDTLSNTVVACYRTMTIKSKEDAAKFAKSFQGTMYLEDDGMDIMVHKEKGGAIQVSDRPIRERGNIFSPYFMASDPIDYIYKSRKAFNKKIRG